VANITSETNFAGRELIQSEIAVLIDACQNVTTEVGVHDSALIALAYSEGLLR
jgi:hypothetical protein